MNPLEEIGLARLEELELEGYGSLTIQRLVAALGYSDFLYRVLLRASPRMRRRLLEWAAGPPHRGILAALFTTVPSLGEAAELGLGVIALRELCALAPVRESLVAASALAQEMLKRALAAEAESHLVVFALGKLGGRELNFYSDLDLVLGCVCGADSGRMSAEVARARRFLARLKTPYRIDLRLRPFGQSGPPVMGLGAMEAYFQHHGREWERYAWIKARVVAGLATPGREFLERLEPFIYRRYLDYHALDALREMKREIGLEAGARPGNIKCGPGGIREIEFIVQAFQLVRGGRCPELSGSHLRAALAAAGRCGLLNAAEVERLSRAYQFLRRVENRLQMQRLAPVHHLPTAGNERERLAVSLGYKNWVMFQSECSRHQDGVQEMFEAILGVPKKPFHSWVEQLWGTSLVPDAAIATLQELGFRDPRGLAERLARFGATRRVRLMSDRGRRALNRLIPLLIESVSGFSMPDAVLLRLLDLVYALLRRSVYLALLVERPAALERLVTLVGRSAWIAQRLAAAPAALDELLDPRVSAPAPAPVLVRRYRHLLKRSGDPTGEDDAALELREVNEIQRLKIAAALVDGSYNESALERDLTRLAEGAVKTALQLAAARMRARVGGLSYELLVLAYGKLGSRELGLESDLDLVFLYDRVTGDGHSGMEPGVYLARLAQRALSLLIQPTASGPLYRVDTRLRPEGSAGLLLSRFDAWCRYQREHAWLWERQALLRARPVAGSPRLARRFHRERLALLARSVPPAELAQAITGMRARVARSGPPESPLTAALLDGEFLTAYWVLVAIQSHPPRGCSSRLSAQLGALQAQSIRPQASQLATALELLRENRNRRVLGLAEDAPATAWARERIAVLWRTQFGAPSPI